MCIGLWELAREWPDELRVRARAGVYIERRGDRDRHMVLQRDMVIEGVGRIVL